MLCSGIKKNEDMQVLKEHSSHKDRLLNIKPRIDTNPPKQMPHLHNKVRNQAIKSNSMQTIQSQNQLLLHKMMEISARSSKFQGISESLSARSLNLNNRANQINKITEENYQLLSRLQSVKSNYSLKKWNNDYQHNRYLCQKLSENSRRIPRVSSMGGPSFDSSRGLQSRPETESIKFIRPSTSSGSRLKPSQIEL